MDIALLYADQDKFSASCVQSALRRSFTVVVISSFEFADDCLSTFSPNIIVLINPQDSERALLQRLAQRGRKLILLGNLGDKLATDVGLEVSTLRPEAESWGAVQLSADNAFDAAVASVVYTYNHPLTAQLSLRHRPLSRYDFTDEWNTLGFGRITVDGGLWSISQQAIATQAQVVAQISNVQGETLTAYAAIADRADSSILWFNRAVGPIDSLEWTMIEAFCSDYRAEELACIPYVLEIPAGYDGAMTMRLDCDQAIATARPLFELYQDLGVPLSLAVVTGLPPEPSDMKLLRDVLSNGGAVISHSNSHPPNWGADYAIALREAKDSRAWLEANLPQAYPVHYAVSPFHQNPPYAVRALSDAGYLGFVGGIIHNNPEYLLARSGLAPLCEAPIISHSQQCMFHGDCYHRYGNSVAPYCESFTHHLRAESIFGYLDHPFSSSYQYGWNSESERLLAHASFLKFVKAHGDIWFPNLVECLEFVRKRSLLRLSIDKDQLIQASWHSAEVPLKATPPLQVRWRGKTTTLADPVL
ncbi:MAG: hypothetical protein DCF32_02965 [Leptolyngbya sp.]|nr:MAG: hypothetical protein DCF32_02965 [Leptolyngbya sp.]